jgi:hypothetical protein
LTITVSDVDLTDPETSPDTLVADYFGRIPGSLGIASDHVAGRRFSRSAARRRISARAVASQRGHVWFDP